jgi:hypothetical protein
MDTNQPIESTNKYSLAKIEFAEVTQPNFTAQKNKDWVLYGDKNDYTKYLIDLFNRHAEHNAIISAKTNYIAGKGLKYDKTLEDEKQKAKLDKFIAYANRYQSWDAIIPMMTLDFELFNGYALQFIYGVGGKITDVYHLEFSKIRISKCGKKAYYCDNWYVSKPENDKSFACYDLYNEEIKSGTCIFYFKVHRPTALEYGSVYPIPDYIGATSAIETDINVDVFHLSNTQNGMTAQGMLSFFNGEPTREEKAKLKQMFENNYTGPNKAGKTILKFSNENEKGAEFLNFSVTDLDKQFEVLSKRLQQKIISGHKVTNPILFGIKTEGQLGNRQELIESYEHFTKTYIDVRRPNILLGVQLVAKKNDLAYNELYIEPLSPIGLEIPISEQEIAASLTFDEKRTLIAEKYGIELTAQDTDRDKRLTIVNKLGVGGTQSLMEVIKDTSISAQRKAEIINILFGININKAYKLVGFDPLTIQPTVQPTQMSDKDLILEALLNCGSEINDDEVLGSVNIECEEDAIKFESSHAHNFADVLSGDIRTVRNAILDLLAGNPSVEPEFLAKQLGLDVEYIQEQIDYMIEKSVITESVSGFTPTGKGLDKLDDIEPIKTEVYTVYRYETREDVPDAKSGSREFCTKLMKAKREYTRDQINDLNNQFSTDVWRYRGGWYSNPDTGEVEKWCRHIWKGFAKVRKKGAKK